MDTYARSAAPLPCHRSPFAPTEPCRSATSDHHHQRATAGGMRLDPVVHLSMLVIGVSFACYSPSLSSLQDQAYQAAVPRSVSVRVLDVWPVNSGGLERDQLVTYYIFFMDPTDEPLVFKASYAPLDTSGKNLKKYVGKVLCVDCGKASWLSFSTTDSGLGMSRGSDEGPSRALGLTGFRSAWLPACFFLFPEIRVRSLEPALVLPCFVCDASPSRSTDSINN
ncbi:hypothetical protein NHX12_008748, partial [Muraenolepis orangiensis]